MANYYYEMSDYVAEHATVFGMKGKYFCSALKSLRISHELGRNSDRIWREDDRGVTYVKHRYENPETAKVDLKEFMWIKLQCKIID